MDLKLCFSNSMIPSTFISCHYTIGKSIVFHYVFIYLFISGYTNGCLFSSVGYDMIILMLKPSQIGLVGTFWSVFCVLWAYLHYSLITCSLSRLTRCSKLIFFPFLPWNQPFLQRTLLPLSGEWYLEIKVWTPGRLIVTGVSLLPSSLRDRARKHMYLCMCVYAYAYLWRYRYICIHVHQYLFLYDSAYWKLLSLHQRFQF